MRFLALVAVVLGGSLFARSADAKLLEIWVQGQAGGIYGFYGTEKYDPIQSESPAQDDFFRMNSGGTFGLQVGVEIFFIDVIMDFAQYYDGNGLSSTLTCFMLGFDWDFALSRRWELTPYVMGGFALATYNNSWVKKDYPQIALADLKGRGALARTGLRLEFKLHEMFRVGVDGGVGYHYMLQTDKAANDMEGHSHGFHGYVMGIVRFQWEPFRKKEEKKYDDFHEGYEPKGSDELGESSGQQDSYPVESGVDEESDFDEESDVDGKNAGADSVQE